MEMNHSGMAQKESAALAFLNKAASVYKPHEGIEDIVLEICFADLQKTYQMVLGRQGCAVVTEGFLPFTARVEADYPVFEDMVKGRRSPVMAIIMGQVKTQGDLRVLKKLEDFFPGMDMET